MNPTQKARFNEKNELDMAYARAGPRRFRVNVFKQPAVSAWSSAGAAKILNFEDLRAPAGADEGRPGAARAHPGDRDHRSGKSTTLAAMIDYINTSRTTNIVTIEDPSEFLHRDKRDREPREIGSDTFSFGDALRSALVKTRTLSSSAKCATSRPARSP